MAHQSAFRGVRFRGAPRTPRARLGLSLMALGLGHFEHGMDPDCRSVHGNGLRHSTRVLSYRTPRHDGLDFVDTMPGGGRRSQLRRGLQTGFRWTPHSGTFGGGGARIVPRRQGVGVCVNVVAT